MQLLIQILALKLRSQVGGDSVCAFPVSLGGTAANSSSAGRLLTQEFPAIQRKDKSLDVHGLQPTRDNLQARRLSCWKQIQKLQVSHKAEALRAQACISCRAFERGARFYLKTHKDLPVQLRLNFKRHRTRV